MKSKGWSISKNCTLKIKFCWQDFKTKRVTLMCWNLKKTIRSTNNSWAISVHKTRFHARFTIALRGLKPHFAQDHQISTPRAPKRFPKHVTSLNLDLKPTCVSVHLRPKTTTTQVEKIPFLTDQNPELMALLKEARLGLKPPKSSQTETFSRQTHTVPQLRSGSSQASRNKTWLANSAVTSHLANSFGQRHP
jgi:hypothetical protein